MLQAEKQLVQANTEVNVLSIRERELALYTRNTNLLGTVSAITAGMGYFGLVYVKMHYFKDSGPIAQATYVLGLTVSMCLALRNLLGTTTIAVLAPGLALRGGKGSMHKAIDGMLIELETVTNMLHQSMHCFMATLVAYSWGGASPHWMCSILLTALAITTSVLITWSTNKVEKTFPVRTMKLTSGLFYTEVLKRRKQVQELLGAGRSAPATTEEPPGPSRGPSQEALKKSKSARADALRPKASMKLVPYHSERMRDYQDDTGGSSPGRTKYRGANELM